MIAHGKTAYSVKLLIEVDVFYEGCVRWQVSIRDKRKGARTDKFAVSAFGFEHKGNWQDLVALQYQIGMPAFITSVISNLSYSDFIAKLKQ